MSDYRDIDLERPVSSWRDRWWKRAIARSVLAVADLADFLETLFPPARQRRRPR